MPTQIQFKPVKMVEISRKVPYPLGHRVHREGDASRGLAAQRGGIVRARAHVALVRDVQLHLMLLVPDHRRAGPAPAVTGRHTRARRRRRCWRWSRWGDPQGGRKLEPQHPNLDRLAVLVKHLERREEWADNDGGGRYQPTGIRKSHTEERCRGSVGLFFPGVTCLSRCLPITTNQLHTVGDADQTPVQVVFPPFFFFFFLAASAYIGL